MGILVVGAGIGGLTAALALRRVGFDAHVYEQASALREVGAGVAISPNAIKVLHGLGLDRMLRAVGVVSRSLDTRDWQSGALLGRVPLAEDAVVRWGAPFYHLHRADLHDALRTALGNEHITLGARCIAAEQRADDVTVHFVGGRDATGQSGRDRSPGAAWRPRQSGTRPDWRCATILFWGRASSSSASMSRAGGW